MSDRAIMPGPAPLLDCGKIDTAHGQFLQTIDESTVALTLRGVNLSGNSKFPNFSKHGSTNTPGDGSQDAWSPFGKDSIEGQDLKGKGRATRDEERRSKRGVDTSLGEEAGFWTEAKKGGEDGWFVGRPSDLEDADTHLLRLRAWGFTAIRLIVTWEALEHSGPGKYDEAYIDYLIGLLRKCKHHHFRVFISPHQDVFSRFLGGSGAPYWVLEAFGINPTKVHSTGAAVLHSQWLKEGYGGVEGRRAMEEGECGEYPDMIWNTNLHRLAVRHCLTMFFASEVFAPKCTIDGLHAGDWARQRWNEAYGHLADRIRDAGDDLLDECLIGWDSMNEPQEGFIGIPDLTAIPPSQEFKRGPSPTPLQGFQLGMGLSVDHISYDDFTSLGAKNLGEVTITPTDGAGLWLSRSEAQEAQQRWGYSWGPEWSFWDMKGDGGCPWAGHGVWNRNEGKILKPGYFCKKPDGKEYQFIEEFWKPHYSSYLKRIRRAHPNAIAFLHPPIFEEPPDLSEEIKRGRAALSAHFYDGLTMLMKQRHLYNADAVNLQRGVVGMLGAVKVGPTGIRNGFKDQFAELKSDSAKQQGMADGAGSREEYPTLIGELGSPWDMKEAKWFGIAQGKVHQKDYSTPAKAMDDLLSGCDGTNALSYTIWSFDSCNSHQLGDGWNREDLSLFSYDDIEGDDDLHVAQPRHLKDVLELGTRGVRSWCRPYPLGVTGKIVSFTFDMESTEFTLLIETDSFTNGPTSSDHDGFAWIYLPFVHYLGEGTTDRTALQAGNRVIGTPETIRGTSEWTQGQGPAVVDVEVLDLSDGKLEIHGQWGRWSFSLLPTERQLHLKLRRTGIAA